MMSNEEDVKPAEETINTEPAAASEPAAAPEPQAASEENAASAMPATITGHAGEAASGSSDGGEPQKQAEPVTYDIKGSIPEGFEFDQGANDAFVEILKNTNVTNEQANAIASCGFKLALDSINAVYEKRNADIKAWGEAARAELGSKFDETVAKCGVAVEALEKANPGLRQALDETGAGNRIEIVRAFARLGELLLSDPGMAGSAAGKPQAASSRYPNTDFSRYL